MSTLRQLSHPYPASSPPSKRAKTTPPSPPAPLRQMEVASTVDPNDELSIFDIQNNFRSRWFLNRDHLIANVLSAQKDEDGRFTWVDFSPPFHTHLVQRARALMPPSCPMGKWKKVMFVFILEVLRGDEGPRPESFWEVPKKRHRPRLPKKPKVSPSEAPEASALPKTLDLDRNDTVMKDMPPPSADLSFIPLTPPHCPGVASSDDDFRAFLFLHPFPEKLDHPQIVSWVAEADRRGFERSVQLVAAVFKGHDIPSSKSLLIHPTGPRPI